MSGWSELAVQELRCAESPVALGRSLEGLGVEANALRDNRRIHLMEIVKC